MLIFSLVSVLVLVLADQLIKMWATGVLQELGTIHFIHFGDLEVLDLTYLENGGAVFGSFSGMTVLLIVVTSILLIACIWGILKYGKRSKFLNVSLVLILAGGIGNLIDRIFHGGLVIDYLEVKLFTFAIFNFADCCVVIGVFLFILFVLFGDSKNVLGSKSDSVEKKENA